MHDNEDGCMDDCDDAGNCFVAAAVAEGGVFFHGRAVPATGCISTAAAYSWSRQRNLM